MHSTCSLKRKLFLAVFGGMGFFFLLIFLTISTFIQLIKQAPQFTALAEGVTFLKHLAAFSILFEY